MRGRSRVRVADITAAAGVSTTAMSFVLNGRDAGSIPVTIRARVLKAAEGPGYCPNHIARGLRQRSTSSIGLVIDAIASPPFGGCLLAAATETAEASDQVLLMMDIGHRTGCVGEAIAALEHRQVDAIIYAIMGFTELAETPKSRTPLVLANCIAPTPGPSSVSSDGAGGATIALEHLADLSHQHVVMLGGHYDPGNPDSGNTSGPVRWGAFRRAARRRSVEAWHVGTGWQIDDGHAAALTTLNVPPGEQPTTLFAVCDRIAVGALLAATKLGLDVPGDVSIIDFDDQEALAGHTVLALTTAVLPHAAMGEATVRTTLDTASRGSETPEHLALPCPLVVRGSTALPPMGTRQARHGTLGITPRASTAPPPVTTRLHGSS